MSKYNCPKCGTYTTITNVVVGRYDITRYRTCAKVACHLHFSTTETVKETPRTRQSVGEDLAAKLWPEDKRFRYRNPLLPTRKKQEKPTT